MRLTSTFRNFFESERAGGFVLLVATALSLLLANSPIGEHYNAFWEVTLEGEQLRYWINDGLMTIFFLLIGLELEREFYVGELSDFKNAALPIIAAIGGMAIPILIFLSLNFGTATQAGVGIPMATDIAFAIGILSLLGSRVPASLKVFLTALAVIDDLGAIMVIAFFYTKTIHWMSLVVALLIFLILLLMNRFNVRNLIPYLIIGTAMWYFMLHSGVHATITGILLAFAIPFRSDKKRSSSDKLQGYLHRPVAFIILPLFAMANTCIRFNEAWYEGLAHSTGIGIILGLFLGKPLGICLFSLVGIQTGFCRLPDNTGWKQLISVGFLGGVGFTVSIFITLLAFENAQEVLNAKIAIIVASVISGLAGYTLLRLVSKKPN